MFLNYINYKRVDFYKETGIWFALWVIGPTIKGF